MVWPVRIPCVVAAKSSLKQWTPVCFFFVFLNIAAHDACSNFASYRFYRVYLTWLKDEDRLTQNCNNQGETQSFPDGWIEGKRKCRSKESM